MIRIITDSRGYRTKFARECLESVKREFPGVDIVDVRITDQILERNAFSRKMKESPNYESDPLRLIYINKYDNCFYCDYDIYFFKGAGKIIMDYMKKYSCFTIGKNSYFIYNKSRNNAEINRVIDFYESIGKRDTAYRLLAYSDRNVMIKFNIKAVNAESIPFYHMCSLGSRLPGERIFIIEGDPMAASSDLLKGKIWSYYPKSMEEFLIEAIGYKLPDVPIIRIGRKKIPCKAGDNDFFLVPTDDGNRMMNTAGVGYWKDSSL